MNKFYLSLFLGLSMFFCDAQEVVSNPLRPIKIQIQGDERGPITFSVHAVAQLVLLKNMIAYSEPFNEEEVFVVNVPSITRQGLILLRNYLSKEGTSQYHLLKEFTPGNFYHFILAADYFGLDCKSENYVIVMDIFVENLRYIRDELQDNLIKKVDRRLLKEAIKRSRIMATIRGGCDRHFYWASDEYNTVFKQNDVYGELSISDFIDFYDKNRCWGGTLFYGGKLNDNGLDSLKGLDQVPYWNELKTLSITGQSLTVLETTFFKNLSNLKELNLSANGIREIEPHSFDGLEKLEELNVSYNCITTMYQNSFKGLSQLKRLDLTYNGISLLPKNSFAGLDTLEELLLAKNPITTLVPGCFKRVPLLKRLNVHRSRIQKIPLGVFSDLDHLDTLVFSHNAAEEFQVQAFVQMVNFVVVSYVKDGIRSVPKKCKIVYD